MLRSFFVVACLLAAGCVHAPRDLAGHWSGVFERENARLDVEFEFRRSEAGFDGAFSAPRLRAIGIPLRNTRADGAQVHFELVGDETTSVFDGVRAGDSITGAYVEGDARGRFSLRRTRTPPPACAESPATFANGAVQLAGTLLAPARTPAPAVLFIHGSGAEQRNASRFTALALCRAGVAALIFDKRGVGDSNGDFRDASFDDLAGDAAAGLAWLAARPGIDARRIGLFGHSQGGTMTPLVASRWPHLAFIVAGAASAVSTADAERFSLRNVVGPRATDDADRAEAFAYVDRIVEAGSYGRGLDALIGDGPRYAAEAWSIELPPADHHYWRFQRRIAGYDAPAYWRAVRVPVLLLYGARDERVPAEPSIAAIRAALAPTTPLTVRIYENADHAFMVQPSGENLAWPQLAAGFPEDVVAFVRASAP